MSYYWRQYRAEILLFGFLGLALVGATAGLITGLEQERQERIRLIAQCMDDGRPEYECIAMFKRSNGGGGSTVVMPIYSGG